MNTALTIFILVASIVTAITSVSTTVLAEKSQGSHGLEVADENVHNTPGGFGGQQDVNFHVGTCQGGHTTTDLNNALGGCSALPSPRELGSGHNGK
jgi:hypothetical protein